MKLPARYHYSTVQDENVIDLELYFQIDCLVLKNLVKKFRANSLSVSTFQNFDCHFRHNNANNKTSKRQNQRSTTSYKTSIWTTAASTVIPKH
jgi:hypothetical protein